MSDDDTKLTEAEAMAALVLPPALVHTTPYHRVFLAPPGWTEHRIERKDYREEAFHAGDVATFLQAAREVADPDASRLMYSSEKEVLQLVVDYFSHDESTQARSAHVIRLTMPRSREWTAWASLDRIPVSKEQLLEHLLEYGHTVQSPPAAEMYELVRDLKAVKKVQFRDVRELQSGSFEIQWSDETKATAGNFKVPKGIVIRCSPWEGGSPVLVDFEFRYKLDDNGLKLTLVSLPKRMSDLKREAFNAVAAGIGGELGLFAFHNATLT